MESDEQLTGFPRKSQCTRGARYRMLGMGTSRQSGGKVSPAPTIAFRNGARLCNRRLWGVHLRNRRPMHAATPATLP